MGHFSSSHLITQALHLYVGVICPIYHSQLRRTHLLHQSKTNNVRRPTIAIFVCDLVHFAKFQFLACILLFLVFCYFAISLFFDAYQVYYALERAYQAADLRVQRKREARLPITARDNALTPFSLLIRGLP